MKSLLFFAVLLLPFSAVTAHALERISRSPYRGAIAIDAASGKVLIADHPEIQGYPASVTKLMTFLIVQDRIKAGRLSLDTPVTVSAAVARIGGSQVYLKQGEVFTVNDLLYAMIVQSANDAAAALAFKVAGTKEAFVKLMNAKARALGMTHTVYHSEHGLPPGRGQKPDVSTPGDLAILARELVRTTDILRYSSTRVRKFRPNSPKPFIMRSHNHLLGHLEGCDGMKTGYFWDAGFSIVATAKRGGQRVIAVVLDSRDRKVRDARASALIDRAFTMLPSTPAPASAPAVSAPAQQPKSSKPLPVVPIGNPGQ